MKLFAGQLSMQYKEGFLRYVRSGDAELIRMIYFALRDSAWGTVPGRIDDERVEQYPDGFRIGYRCSSREGPIAMDWQVNIFATSDHRIIFKAEGLALAGFYINRAGICVLHPVAECRGKPCLIGHPDGNRERLHFPDTISPHQPFLDIATMQWEAAPGLDIHLDFEGEVFETEDHRNWTDHSFKTYSTPLGRPYPVFLPQGAMVRQSLTMTCAGAFFGGDRGKSSANSPPESLSFHSPLPQQAIVYLVEGKKPLPSIGICRPEKRRKGWLPALPFLNSFGFSHYRVEVNLSHEDCREEWQNIRNEAVLLGLPLEIVLCFSANFKKEMEMLAELAAGAAANIKYIVILESGAPCSGNEVIGHTLPLIRSLFPGVAVGSGTDRHFAELNRSSIDGGPLDFVNFSVSPQVHAIDDLTLIENMEGQAEVAISAAKKFPGKPIHISPVTLRQRQPSIAADPRQNSAFIAGWTLGSLKYLAEYGVSSISYYEAAGENGLISYTEDGELHPYPSLEIFGEVLNNGWEVIQPSRSDRPLAVSSLILCRGSEKGILLANHTAEQIAVTFSSDDIGNEIDDRTVTLEGHEICILNDRKRRLLP